MTDSTPRLTAEELGEYISIPEAVKLHKHLNAELLNRWVKHGVLTRHEPAVRIFFHFRPMGGRNCTTRRDVLDFLAALKHDAPEELVEKFS